MRRDFFDLEGAGTTVTRELISGVTTFMTMSYIIFVQPAVLASCGMDFGAVMVATCVASAIATFIMGLAANYPIALAPAMGHNFYFAFTVCGTVVMGGLGYRWETALAAVFVSGSLFIILSFWGMRELILTIVPQSLKNAIAVGIGLLIALVGLEWSGLVVAKPGTLVGLGELGSPPVIASIVGLFVMAALLVVGVRGAIILGMLVSLIISLGTGMVRYEGIVSTPPSIAPTLFKLDLGSLLGSTGILTVIFIFFFLDLFDTVGTLIGVSEQAGFMVEGKLPRARRALLADAIGTVSGSILGTSTVTSYIESASGISEGGRTGLSNMVTGFLFLLSLFLYPLAKMVGGGFDVGGGNLLYPVIAPALILVGSFMFKGIVRINWDRPVEALPAFITIVIMPLTFSITDGIAFGFIAYSVLATVKGGLREAHWLVHVISVLFLIRYVFLFQ
ncbi:MAG: NCS2 family permease [Candidatus Glassbacteria bacterium]